MIRSLAAAALLALAGCASLNSLDADVSSFSRWPEGRAPATYAFERLPSQQAHPQASQVLEDSARRAIEAAGFGAAPEGTEPDVSVQIGARITVIDRWYYADPFWYGPYGYGFHHGFGYGRYGWPYWGWGWGWGPGYYYDYYPYYEREVVVLIRDRKTGEPLYEARANSDGTYSDATALLPAMFSAALQDFPKGAEKNPHRVRVPTTTQ